VVATATQCFIYSVHNFNTPHIFDMRESVNLLLQSERYFATVDNLKGIQIYSYEGRVASNPRFAGLRVEFLNKDTLSLSSKHLAVLDRGSNKSIRVFDTESGRPSCPPMSHNLDILEVALSQFATADGQSYLTFIDKNHDLYITPVASYRPFKLHTMVLSCVWASDSNMLTALADGKLVSWYYPAVVFVDKDLLEATTVSQDGAAFGKTPRLSSFTGSRALIRRGDGAQLHAGISPYPGVLYKYTVNKQWEEAVRLCRFVKAPQLWACLAAMALSGRHLDTAEVALAAVKEVDKLQYILYIKDIPSQEGRAAELALYNRSPDEAERILLQAAPPLVYRAIKLNIRLFRWHRALEIAVDNRTHVDTVLAYRQRYLKQFGREEKDARFLQYAQQVSIDWEAIQAKKKAEKDKEEARAAEED
jgi:intraflagellar transport protein 80